MRAATCIYLLYLLYCSTGQCSTRTCYLCHSGSHDLTTYVLEYSILPAGSVVQATAAFEKDLCSSYRTPGASVIQIQIPALSLLVSFLGSSLWRRCTVEQCLYTRWDPWYSIMVLNRTRGSGQFAPLNKDEPPLNG
jgi:hypothetical protein